MRSKVHEGRRFVVDFSDVATREVPLTLVLTFDVKISLLRRGLLTSTLTFDVKFYLLRCGLLTEGTKLMCCLTTLHLGKTKQVEL